MGLTQSAVGSQVRAAFYGIEAQRVQRASDDIKVKVRYPKNERMRSQDLDSLLIQLPTGEKVPLNTVADYSIEEGFSSIRRIDQRRVINVTADADKSKANLELIRADLMGNKNETGLIDQVLATYPDIKWSFEGEAREQSDIFSSLIQKTLLAMFIIYALLAIPLKSYIQPIIVMSVIPFGLIGAIGGHFILNQPVSILSILGFVALTGVVVNDSLVMIDYINKKRLDGIEIKVAIEQSGVARFRPILLTSLTTFAGLLPILFETSLQAQFLIPMATSLSFGVLFATFITLLLVPAFYTIVNDVIQLFSSDSDPT
jgi:multidrug efflux pump subunit AcrB